MPRVQLTDRFIAGVKPIKGKQIEYFDTSSSGLALRVGMKVKAWEYHFESPRDGKRARAQLGTYPATSLALARTKAIEARGQVEEGRDPRDVLAASAAGAMTVAGLVESYLAKHVRPNLRTAAAIERRVNKNVVPVIGTVRVTELHRRDINRALDPILSRGRQVEAGRVFEDMRAMFRWALARGDLDHSPVEGMRKPNGSAPRERVLSDDEIRILWHGLPKALKRSKTCQRIIKLCLITAQRVGEVAGMRRDELDLEALTWNLPGSRTKNGRPHTVPLSDLAVKIICEALADAGGDAVFVFPVGDDALPPHAVARTIGRAQETSEKRPTGRFGMPRWTAHDLRRTALTNFARLGVAPVVAGAVANHLSVTKASITLSVYTRYTYDREKRDALELWATRLEALVNGEPAKVAALPRRA
jgi:integrase